MSIVYIETFKELANELNQGNVLLVGAPSIGKTYGLFEVFKNDKEVLFVYDQRIQPLKIEGDGAKILFSGELDNYMASLEKFKKIIIDDFFKVSASLKEKSLNIILSRKQGVCLTTTLYRGEKVLQEFTLTLANFKSIFYKVDKIKAMEKITEYLHQKVKKEAKDKTITKIVKHSKWSYILDRKLWNTEVNEYSTFIPYWFVDSFLEFGENGLKILTEEFLYEMPVAGIDASLHSMAHEISESNLSEIAKEFYHDVIPTITGALPVLLYGTSSGLLIGAFAILRKIIGKKKEKVEEFRPFVSLLQMRPQDIENLEKKLGCPPLTLFTIREFMKPGNLHRLREAVEETKELKKKYEEFEEKYGEGLQKLDEIETKLKEAENKLRDVGEITQCFKGINKTISDSIKDPFLCFDTLEPLKRQGIIPKYANIKIIERDEIAAGIIKAIDDGKKLIVIKGKGGVGKSSLMTFLAEKLKERGFFVGVPFIDNPFLELKVEQEKHRMGGNILLTEYGMEHKSKEDMIAGLEDLDLRFMINLLLLGKCTAVIMECRSEYNLAFKIALNKIRGLDIPRYEIELHGVERMEDVVNQIFNTPKVLEQMEDIKGVSRENGTYNPLFAILAASWIDRGKNLNGLSTDNFLEEFVDELFYKDKTQEVQRIFTLLSLCKGIEKEDLRECKSLWALPTDDLSTKWDKIESVMKSYLDGNSYVIKPDLISEVIFKNKALKFYNDYVDILFNLKHGPAYCIEMAKNLGEMYQADMDCIEQAYILLEKVRESGCMLYFTCMSALIFAGLHIELKKISIKLFIDGAEGLATMLNFDEKLLAPVNLETEALRKKIDLKSQSFIITQLAYLIENNVFWGKEGIEVFEGEESLANQVTKILIDEYKRQGKKFFQEEFMIELCDKIKDTLIKKYWK